MSIDFAIVEKKTKSLMGDNNIYYQYEKERQPFDTITIPYRLHVTSTEFPTRVKGNIVSLSDYFISNLLQLKNLQTVFSDILL